MGGGTVGALAASLCARLPGAEVTLVDVNPALLRSTSYSAGELEGHPIDLVFVDYDRLCDLARETQRGTVAAFGECRVRARDGRMIDADVTLGEVAHAGKRLLCLVARDITLRKQAERQREEHRRSLEHLANHDPLTGLPNRLSLKAQLPQLLRDLTGTQGDLALFYIDLDEFKGINDSRGHAAGDELLRITAQRLRRCRCCAGAIATGCCSTRGVRANCSE